ncbi:hypothetical protein TBLA_0B08690 [Henningerozyma blattae CBS 6284]|uniref:Uncharacterized protein n=1 Tax=Henningerozyma blattae (strain ATCC 34711 / CBS 6284 / DSM 70876 / NBRC 10599 / NRRL Y-10934 / UCD 77-7) TaxID=1071380 RepID=I2GZY2_HENB6|nr:hypothetical protein TBLA_0B08690 [Tetrapisispora blattae CBS 6284]CCH59684.1 hypothetical protein TBLA_0B08690 [Tetrapisispora blattae CBS 6284]
MAMDVLFSCELLIFQQYKKPSWCPDGFSSQNKHESKNIDNWNQFVKKHHKIHISTGSLHKKVGVFIFDINQKPVEALILDQASDFKELCKIKSKAPSLSFKYIFNNWLRSFQITFANTSDFEKCVKVLENLGLAIPEGKASNQSINYLNSKNTKLNIVVEKEVSLEESYKENVSYDKSLEILNANCASSSFSVPLPLPHNNNNYSNNSNVLVTDKYASTLNVQSGRLNTNRCQEMIDVSVQTIELEKNKEVNYKISKRVIKQKLKDKEFMQWVDKIEKVLKDMSRDRK